MKIKFLTWNVKNNKSKAFCRDLNTFLYENTIDVLVLQEFFSDKFLNEIAGYEEIVDFLNASGKRWVRIFIRKDSKIIYEAPTSFASNKLRACELVIPNGFRFNLFGAHLYSQAGKSKSQQVFENNEIPNYIIEFENSQNNQRSIIVGDLNYRPFDVELLHPQFLNSLNDKKAIEMFGNNRKIGKVAYSYFYNPMWNLLGDYDYVKKISKPTGTYYWYPDDVEKFHWNLIDGVLLSPGIMDKLMIESLEIVTEINSKLLIKSSISKTEETFLNAGYSDHLPIQFSLNA